MYIIDIIDKKRKNKELSKEEIYHVVNNYLNNNIKDYQMASLLMAICINGLNSEESFYLTEAMLNSGKVIDLSPIKGVKVDKHSTGGVGDKTTLIVGPIVASLGVPVIKMSGRSLGYTGGTIDKLESIPGYDVNLSIDEMINNVNKINISLSTTSKDLAPADKKIYALRDVTGTVSSKALIASSIMSKKLATGADKILLDVKYGNGALMTNKDDAIELARLMVYIGNKYGKETKAVITSMNTPLGSMVGNALEIKEVIDILNNKGDTNLRDLCIILSSYMVSMSLGVDFLTAENMVNKSLKSGMAYEKFKELIKEQGGNLEKLVISNKVVEIKSKRNGFINEIDALKIAKISFVLGSGKRTLDDKIDHSVGVELVKKVGDFVNEGDVVAKLYVGNRLIDDVIVLDAFKIENVKKEVEPLVLGVIK